MSGFRKITEKMLVSPQLELDDIPAAKASGVALIVNNRPDGEDPVAPQGEAIAAAAAEAGIAYLAIPVGHSGIAAPQVEAMVAAIEQADGPILAYCRSGTRSTFLWALAEAKRGGDPDTIARTAAGAGYDIGPVRPMVDMLAAR